MDHRRTTQAEVLRNVLGKVESKINISSILEEQREQDLFLAEYHDVRLHRYDIIPDGNSLFRAVAASFPGDQSAHRNLRNKVVDYIRENSSQFQNDITQNVDEYLATISQPGCPGGIPELKALSNVLDIKIIVLRGGTDEKELYFEEDYFGSTDGKQSTIYLSQLSNKHFDALFQTCLPNHTYEKWLSKQLHLIGCDNFTESDATCDGVTQSSGCRHDANSLLETNKGTLNRKRSDGNGDDVRRKRPKKSTISDFLVLVHEIAGEITDKECKRLTDLCSERIPRRALQDVKHPMDLFRLLIDQKLLSSDKKGLLGDLLKHIRRIDLVTKLDPKHPSINSVSDRIAWMVTFLKDEYKRHFKNFHPIPWNDEVSLSLTKIYTRLRVVENDNRGQYEKGEVLSNEHDIFEKSENGCSARCIKIDGGPAMGKSTFCRKLAYDWACDDLPQFELLFLLEMRHVSESKHRLEEIVFEQLMPKDVPITLSDLAAYVGHNQNSVLYLFDGFDEIKQKSKSNSDISDVIMRKMLPWCTVATTTRPHECDKDLKKCDVHFTIEGFTPDDAIGYIERYFSKATDQAQSLISKLKLRNVPTLPNAYWRESSHSDERRVNHYQRENVEDDVVIRFDEEFVGSSWEQGSAEDVEGESDEEFVGSSLEQGSAEDVEGESDGEFVGSSLEQGSAEDYEGEGDEESVVSSCEEGSVEDMRTVDGTERRIQYDLLCNPLHLSFLCLLWEEKQAIPALTTNVYSEILECILMRYCHKKDIELNNGNVPTHLKDEVTKLASLAYSVYSKGEMMLDGEKIQSPIIQSLGLLVRDTGMSRIKLQNLCFFYHKTWLEYFTALHVHNLVKEPSCDVESVIGSVKDYNQVVLFLAGFLKDKATVLLEMLGREMLTKSYQGYYDITEMLSFLLKCAYEACIDVKLLSQFIPNNLVMYDSPLKDHYDDTGISLRNHVKDRNQLGYVDSRVIPVCTICTIKKITNSYNDSEPPFTLSVDGDLSPEMTEKLITCSITNFRCICRTTKSIQALARTVEKCHHLKCLMLYCTINMYEADHEKKCDAIRNLFRSISLNGHIHAFHYTLFLKGPYIGKYSICPLPLTELIEKGPKAVSVVLIPRMHSMLSTVQSATDSSSTFRLQPSLHDLCKFVTQSKQTKRFTFYFYNKFFLGGQNTRLIQLMNALECASKTFTSIGLGGNLEHLQHEPYFIRALTGNDRITNLDLRVCINYSYVPDLIRNTKYLQLLNVHLPQNNDFVTVEHYQLLEEIVQAVRGDTNILRNITFVLPHISKLHLDKFLNQLISKSDRFTSTMLRSVTVEIPLKYRHDKDIVVTYLQNLCSQSQYVSMNVTDSVKVNKQRSFLRYTEGSLFSRETTLKIVIAMRTKDD
ncbi:uncharacterized protein LOC144445699 [Glandiceps talaboti]